MSDATDVVQTEIERQRVAAEAAKEMTRGNLSLGWKIVIGGWFLPIIPILGFFLMVPAALVGGVLGILVWTKGNGGGGLKLILGAWLGTAMASFIWIGIYAAIASRG